MSHDQPPDLLSQTLSDGWGRTSPSCGGGVSRLPSLSTVGESDSPQEWLLRRPGEEHILIPSKWRFKCRNNDCYCFVFYLLIASITNSKHIRMKVQGICDTSVKWLVIMHLCCSTEPLDRWTAVLIWMWSVRTFLIWTLNCYRVTMTVQRKDCEDTVDQWLASYSLMDFLQQQRVDQLIDPSEDLMYAQKSCWSGVKNVFNAASEPFLDCIC